MAFNSVNFTPIGGQSRRGKAPQMFSYATADALTTIDGSGYFNGSASVGFGGVYHHLEIGDIIFAVVHTTSVGSGTVTDAGVFIVNGKNTTTGIVDVTNAVDLFVTDAD